MNKNFKIVIFALGIVVLIYGFIYTVGTMNPNGLVKEQSVTIDTPLETTWNKLTDPTLLPKWASFISDAGKKVNSNNQEFWVINLKFPENQLIFQVNKTLEPQRSLQLTSTPAPGASARVKYRLTFFLYKFNDKTQITIREERVGLTTFSRGLMKLQGKSPSDEWLGELVTNLSYLN